MTGCAPEISDDDAVLDAAIAWQARIRSGRLTESDAAELHTWLEPAAHSSAFARVRAHWDALEPIRSHPEILEMRDNRRAYTPGGRRLIGMVAIAAALVLVVLVGGLLDLGNLRLGQRPPSEEFAADNARLALNLSDGSSVLLDSNSRVRVTMSRSIRRIDLMRGRAYFQVAKDAARPFEVAAGGRLVRALGTSFTVDIAADRLDVVLLEGRVRVAALGAAAQAIEMLPARRLRISAAGTWTLAPVNLEQATAWTQGRLVFDDAPLAEVAAELNRYSDRQIVLADEITRKKRIGAVLDSGDVDTFVRAVEAAGLARATRRPDGGLTLHQ